MCSHVPPCPPATSPAHGTARVAAAHHEQGWSLLCNGVVVFDDDGELLPDGRALAPPRADAVQPWPSQRGDTVLRPLAPLCGSVRA